MSEDEGRDQTDDQTDDETDESETEAQAEADAEQQAEIEEIEAERERRLDPDNRPDNAIVDNSDAELPTVERFAELNREDDEAAAAAGSSDPAETFRDLEYSEEEKQQIAEEREQRLDPDNRPDNVEIDNTGRTFEDGKFVD